MTNDLYVLRKFVEFPAALLGVPDQPLLPILERALFTSSVLALSRLSDESRGALTLARFRETLLKCVRHEASREELRKVLDKHDFDSRLGNLIGRVKHLRNNKLAHLGRENLGSPEEVSVTLREVEDACSLAQDLVLTVSLGHGRAFHYPEYSDLINRSDHQPDIDVFLEALAGTGSVLRMPEEQPDLWDSYRAELDPNQIEQINAYRLRLGLHGV